MYYGARYYDPQLGRFIQPDTIVPEPGNPQSLNRYAYANNNPLKYRDPSGHWVETAWDVFNIGWDLYEVQRDPSLLNIGALVVDVGAAVLPFVPAGVGMVVRGGKAVKAAVEVASHADEVADAGRVVAEVATHADEAADALRAIKTVEDTPTVLLSIQKSAEDVVDISPQAQRYLQALKEQGQVIVPRGETSARIMGEISAAAGAEVGLFRLHSGERVMVLGEAHSVAIPQGTRRIIAHTHPSGILQFSKADMAALAARGQRSSVLIDLLGRGRRIHIPE